MRTAIGSLIAAVALAACALQSSTKPVEYLDERTAVTVAALKEPVELLPGVASVAAARGVGKRISFAYLGPVEWDNAGQYTYSLWVHVAAGSDWAAADIRTPAAVTMVLDAERIPLVPMDAPPFGRAAYQPIASWGQSAYFALTVKLLKRMAASQKLTLEVRGNVGETLAFMPTSDTHAVLGEFVRARSLVDED